MRILALSFALVSTAFSAPQLSEKDAAEVGKQLKQQLLAPGMHTDEEAEEVTVKYIKELRLRMQYSPRILVKLKNNVPIRPKGYYNAAFEDVFAGLDRMEKRMGVLTPTQKAAFKNLKKAFSQTKAWMNEKNRPVMQKEGMVIEHYLSFGSEPHEQGLRSPATLEITQKEAQSLAIPKNIQKFLTDAKSLVPARTEKDFKWGKLCYQGATLKFDLRESDLMDVDPVFFYVTKNTVEQRVGVEKKKLTLEVFKNDLKLYSKIARDHAWVRVHVDPSMTMEEVIKRMQDLQKCYPKGLYPNLTRKLDEDEPTKPKVKSTLKRRPPQPVPPQQIPQA